jgi:peptidoglycan-N-acetylglucosamine deacetylase
VVVALDADTHFQRDAISKLARWFDDPAVGAVAGNAKVGNRVNVVTRWQALEYITSQNLERRTLQARSALGGGKCW